MSEIAKASSLFIKDDKLSMIVNSSNMRWIVNLETGDAKFFAKMGYGTVEELEKKGYKYFKMYSEMVLLESELEKEPVKLLQAPVQKIEAPALDLSDIDVPSEYKPFGSFELLLKEKMK